MGFFDSDSDQAQSYDQYQNTDNKAELSHEVISGAAAFEAAKAYENHVEENGQPESHARAKEIMAGFAGAFIDREAETKGLDFVDREKAKYDASQQAQGQLDTNQW